MKRWFIILTIFVAVLSSTAYAQGEKKEQEPMLGKPAPELKAEHWLNSSAPLSLAHSKGKVVVVEFWATWCGPCKVSIPHLIELNKTYKSKGVVIAGLTDESQDVAEPFVKQLKMDYPVGVGSTSAEAYQVDSIPQAFVVGKHGKIVWAGRPLDGLEKGIEQALNEK